MSVKGGDLIHAGNQVLLDRVQTAGPGNLNIPTEKIYELGNYQAVGTILDIPDLSFPMESFDASAEFEAMLVGKTTSAAGFDTLPAGDEFDISKARPMDIASQFKPGKYAPAPYDVEMGVAVPHLTLEQLSYRFGLRENAQQSATLRGDSVFYAPGGVVVEEFAGTGVAGQTVSLTNPAYAYNGDTVGGTRYVLGVSVVGTGRRLSKGPEYTETATVAGDTATVVIDVDDSITVPTTDKIRVIYSTSTTLSYPQTSHALASTTRPAAIRGRNIRVYVGGQAITDVWTGVQQFTCDWRVTLDRDEEFGNPNIVGSDYDVPEVNGTIDFKPRNPTELLTRVQEIAGVPATEVVGALQRVKLPLDIVLYSPDAADTPLKTLHVPDARFTVPGYQGRVQQKMTVTFNFESDTGVLKVYKGARVAT